MFKHSAFRARKHPSPQTPSPAFQLASRLDSLVDLHQVGKAGYRKLLRNLLETSVLPVQSLPEFCIQVIVGLILDCITCSFLLCPWSTLSCAHLECCESFLPQDVADPEERV